MNKDFGKIVIVLAHPDLTASRANKELIEAVKELDYVTIYNLYEENEILFNVEEWMRIMLKAKVLIFQFPLYWMSAPHMLKKWQDEVFTHLANTPVIIGKTLLVTTTTGSKAEAYRSGGHNLFTIDEILRPYQAAAFHAGMRWETPVVLHGMAEEDPGRSISKAAIEYKKKIEILSGDMGVSKGSNW